MTESGFETSIAIIGMGCRFPHADSPEEFWQLLIDGHDAIDEVPRDRWNTEEFYHPDRERKGRVASRWGGYLKNLEEFDPYFFGITPREAQRMDPQHRLLLETAWEAFEDAGITWEQLDGADMGVFAGASSAEYSRIQMEAEQRPEIDPYTNSGASLSIAANRISFVFNLKGPSFTLDSACSSSLTALHLACRSLQSGDCSTSLVAASNIILHVETHMGFSAAGLMAPDGRCKCFDDSANGFVRSEGVGGVVLKPLKDAMRDGDKIYAVIRGTSINQDGFTRTLTTPDKAAQVKLLLDACRSAGVQPGDIQYVEAHCTGTPVGDVIEAAALGEALGQADRAGPLYIGSVKSNIGHLEAAAGIAGLVKTALAIHHKTIPPSIHFETPNANISFDELNLEVVTEKTPWSSPGGELLAGVSAFGFGGANAHAILSSPPEVVKRDASPMRRPALAPFSAKTGEALNAIMQRVATDVPATSPLAGIVATAVHRRSHFRCRRAIVASSTQELLKSAGELSPSAGAHADRLVFLFSGQGTQWAGMGAALFDAEPAFAAVLNVCTDEFLKYGDWSLMEELRRDAATTRLNDTAIAQPAIFAIQVGLSRILESWGIVADGVVGHSVGEIAAAHVAGILSLEDACKLIFYRASTMRFEAHPGAMLAVFLSEEAMMDVVADVGLDDIETAAVNAPEIVTVSGSAASITRLEEECRDRDIYAKRLKTSNAFHSRFLDPVQAPLMKAIADVKHNAPLIPMYSTVSGDEIGLIDADYWWRNVRQCVRFSDAVANSLGDQETVFLELGPSPALGTPVKQIMKACGKSATVFAAMKRDVDPQIAILRAVGDLYESGIDPDWQALHPDQAQHVSLPTYQWQRELNWLEYDSLRAKRTGWFDHPLLGRRLRAAVPTWELDLEVLRLDWITDHKIGDRVVFPGTCYVEMACAVACMLYPDRPMSLTEIEIDHLLFLEGTSRQRLQTIVHEVDMKISFYLCMVDESTPSELMAECRLVDQCAVIDPPSYIAELKQATPSESISHNDFYSDLAARGFGYGKLFRGVQSVRLFEEGVVIDVTVADGLDLSGYHLHPVISDACCQRTVHGYPADTLALPFRVREVYVHWDALARLQNGDCRKLTVYARTALRTDTNAVMDIHGCDENGVLMVELRGLETRVVTDASAAKKGVGALLLHENWESLDMAETDASNQKWAVFAQQPSNLAGLLDERLAARSLGVVSELDVEGVSNIVFCAHPDSPDFADLFALQRIAGDLSQRKGAWRLCVVLGKAASPSGPALMAHGALAGLLRVIRTECGNIDVTSVELPATPSDVELDSFVHVLADPAVTGEDIRIRKGQIRVRRVTPSLPTNLCTDDRNAVLSFTSLMSPIDVLLEPMPVPAADEILIEVVAVGLNFSDVIKILQMYPNETGMPEYPGIEGSGIVVGVGSEVRGLEVGDRVVVIGPVGLSRFTTIPAKLAVGISGDSLSLVEAAGLPVAYLTAYYALCRRVVIKPGDRVLIHSATGGVGQAAINICRWKGATVVATAGSADKRALLRDQGIEYVFNSRDTAFAEQIRRTDGLGAVDVVLNTLTGDGLRAGLQILDTFGHFIELGKKDIFMDSGLGLYAMRNSLSFHVIDLNQTVELTADDVHDTLEMILSDVQTGNLPMLPVKEFPVGAISTALSDMSRAQHVGKLVVSMRDGDLQCNGLAMPPIRYRDDVTYLITGGCSGLGLEWGKRMAANGARHIILCSRRGTVEDWGLVKQDFDRYDCEVMLVSADVTDVDAMRALVDASSAGYPPLVGIVHAAAVLDDSLIRDLDQERLLRVVNPKAVGAWNLHIATEGTPLDFFVLLSSTSAIFGNPGQGNYAAANLAVEAIAEHRRALGLPVHLIHLGHLSDVGMTARNEELQGYLQRTMGRGMSAGEAIDAAEQVMQTPCRNLIVARMNFRSWARVYGGWNDVPAHKIIKEHVGDDDDDVVNLESLVDHVLNCAPEDRLGIIEDGLLQQIAAVLQIPVERLDPARPLAGIGFDSLMAIELRNSVERELGVNIPAVELIRGPSVRELAVVVDQLIEEHLVR